MEYRELGRTGWSVSAISFGTWAIGSAWGEVDDKESIAALNRAVDLGVNFFDTAGSGQDTELFSFTTDVDSGQRAEIRIMQTMLRVVP